MRALAQFFRDLALLPEIWRWNRDRARAAHRAARDARKASESVTTVEPAIDPFYERYVLEPRRRRERFRRGVSKIAREAALEVICGPGNPQANGRTPATCQGDAVRADEDPAVRGGAL